MVDSSSLAVSVVVISKDEAPRLRLALGSLRQAAGDELPYEVVVVDDGSRDGTAALLEAERTSHERLVVVSHEAPVGRSAARNAGARLARGRRVLFLDGDVLLAPGAVAAHAALGDEVMGRGETYHLRCTRFFLDPETCTPMPGQEDRVARMTAELDRSRVTLSQVLADFASIDGRAEPGIYPGAGPRQLFELEMRALRERPGMSVEWMTIAAQNMSFPREAFLAVGGFDERLTINEHRELGRRLCKAGLHVAAVPARSYHMTHRVGWRDPISETSWERVFYERHPDLATKLMAIFWQSLANDPHVPPEARIDSLERMEAIVTGGSAVDYDAVRRAHPALADLAREAS